MNANTPVKTIYGGLRDKFKATWEQQIEALKSQFGSSIEEVRLPGGSYPTDIPIVYVNRDSLVAVLEYMKTNPSFSYRFLVDITATDEGGHQRFEVVYQLLSHETMARIRIKVRVPEGEEVPTVISLWTGANWAEREVWDMYGIRFRGHPDLRRILMDERWVGHPLRKDYPLRGYQIFPDAQPIRPELLE